MRTSVISLSFLIAFQTYAQVLDVNGDNQVGAEEAIAVAEQWKGAASAANDHSHLGQTWTGAGNPLRIEGEFPEVPVIGQNKGSLGFRAPLILDNKAGGIADFDPDLMLEGANGVIAAYEHSYSDLALRSNNNILITLNADDGTSSTALIVNTPVTKLLELGSNGNLDILGELTANSFNPKIDHPLDPENKVLNHATVDSPSQLNLYRGRATLDEEGEAWVELPEYIEALNGDFEYQLTCVGGFAPVYVAEEVRDSRFKIAGGSPGLDVSWSVTGIRRDPYAKANPLVVEEEKSEEEKGKYLRPDLYGEPREKRISIGREE